MLFERKKYVQSSLVDERRTFRVSIRINSARDDAALDVGGRRVAAALLLEPAVRLEHDIDATCARV